MDGHREMQGAYQKVREILYLRGLRQPEVLAETIVDNLLESNEIYSPKQVEEQLKIHQKQYKNICDKYLVTNSRLNDLINETELYTPLRESVEFLLKEIQPLIKQSQRASSVSFQEKANRALRAFDMTEYLLQEINPNHRGRRLSDR